MLKSAFGLTEVTFAYPYGYGSRRQFGPTWAETAKATGVLCALTMESDPVAPGSDPFDWGRFHVDSTDTAATLAAKLDGWYSLARTAWLRIRGRPPASQAAGGAELDQRRETGAQVSSGEEPAD